MSNRPATHPAAVPTGDAPRTSAAARPGPALLAAGFVAAGTFLIGLNAPLQIGYQPQPATTLGLLLVGLAILAWGTFRPSRVARFGGAGLLLATTAACLASQPSQFGAATATTAVIRAGVVVGIAVVWAFLLEPPAWLRRGLIALATPTALVLFVAGAAPLVAPRAGAAPAHAANFVPYWLAVDGTGRLYAASAAGNEILAFDPSGNPLGIIRPALAPALGTPGPGIAPIGFEGLRALAATTPGPATTPSPVASDPDLFAAFSFCGLATDPQNHLYVVDWANPQVLQFDAQGNISGRWHLPADYAPTTGCLAADTQHIYAGSGDGRLFVFDLAGKLLHTWALGSPIYGIAAGGLGQTTVMGHNFLQRLDAAGTAGPQVPLPAPATVLQTPYQTLALTANGDTLVGDIGRHQVLVLDAQTGRLRRTVGAPGTWPGQFRGLGGLALDSAGRVYVADWQHRVVQRFATDGQVDAVWWAVEIEDTGRPGVSSPLR